MLRAARRHYGILREGFGRMAALPSLRFAPEPRPRLSAGQVAGEAGAQGRNRTTDTVIFSHVLYQLSYLGPQKKGLASDLMPERAAP
jgi:hypothetical protein